jgi:hypothetical protein
VRILRGTEKIAPSPKDKRFADPRLPDVEPSDSIEHDFHRDHSLADDDRTASPRGVLSQDTDARARSKDQGTREPHATSAGSRRTSAQTTSPDNGKIARSHLLHAALIAVDLPQLTATLSG